ncbi:unnamed protein product [Clonostachys rosea f. rosea IK726]|uniref:Uncharacterized protein n=1 Tax=Clonostachys rosea f. rosea IK726 TaxID=1349383 RepID=A0ACA9TD20_BIOOC|nr:unnamed protein product [Clonostachys rosea f. rosea IK726]
MTNDFRFSIPDILRTFTLFPSLPAELRQEIWHSVISEPGIHFVKFGDGNSKLTWVSRPSQRLESTVEGWHYQALVKQRARRERREGSLKRIADARLTPLESNHKADISNYKTLREELARISAVCKESASFVSSLLSRPGTLSFESGGLLSLQESQDVVYIEYFPIGIYQTGCALAVDPFCPELQKIRRVAVRFCHQWQHDELPVRCAFCRQVHTSGTRKSYPTHLYQFLARCFPNLEQVWLIDYFLRPRAAGNSDFSAPKEDNDAAKGPIERTLHKFRCHGRIYHEATPGLWNVKADSVELKTWLQESFVRYAKNSSHGRVKGPDKVKFGFLACDWQYQYTSPPVIAERKISKYSSRYKRPVSLPRRFPPTVYGRMEDLRHIGHANKVQADIPFVFGQGRYHEFNPELRL